MSLRSEDEMQPEDDVGQQTNDGTGSGQPKISSVFKSLYPMFQRRPVKTSSVEVSH